MARDVLLVPVDYTGCAYEVVGRAADMAGKLKADAVLMYVVRLPAGLSPDTMIHPAGSEAAMKAVEYLDEDAREHLEPFVALFEGTGSQVRIALEHGEIPEAILRTAERVEADMIIMGTHGRTGLRRLVEGSVAEQVIRRALCPVMTIRSPSPTEQGGLTDAQAQALAEAAG